MSSKNKKNKVEVMENKDVVLETNKEETIKNPQENIIIRKNEQEPVQNETPNVEEKKTKSKIEKASENAKSRKEVTKEAKVREQNRIQKTNENQAFFADWSSMKSAMDRSTILTGKVAGIEEISITGTARDNEKKAVFLAVILNNRFKVRIPFEEIYRENPIDMKTVDLNSPQGINEYIRRQKQMAEKLYGLEIPFCIKELFLGKSGSFDDYSILGSRKEAITLMEKANFGIRNGVSNITEGSFVDGKITAVSVYSVNVNVGGVDTTINIRDLTYRYVTNAQHYYKVGDTLNVKVLEIKRDSKDQVHLKVSALMSELVNAKMRQSMLPVQTRTVGIITSIRKSKNYADKIVILAYLEHYNMPCVVHAMSPSALGRELHAGDEIRLIVTDFHENGYVFAKCTGTNGAPGFLNR